MAAAVVVLAEQQDWQLFPADTGPPLTPASGHDAGSPEARRARRALQPASVRRRQEAAARRIDTMAGKAAAAAVAAAAAGGQQQHASAAKAATASLLAEAPGKAAGAAGLALMAACVAYSAREDASGGDSTASDAGPASPVVVACPEVVRKAHPSQASQPARVRQRAESAGRRAARASVKMAAAAAAVSDAGRAKAAAAKAEAAAALSLRKRALMLERWANPEFRAGQVARIRARTAVRQSSRVQPPVPKPFEAASAGGQSLSVQATPARNNELRPLLALQVASVAAGVVAVAAAAPTATEAGVRRRSLSGQRRAAAPAEVTIAAAAAAAASAVTTSGSAPDYADASVSSTADLAVPARSHQGRQPASVDAVCCPLPAAAAVAAAADVVPVAAAFAPAAAASLSTAPASPAAVLQLRDQPPAADALLAAVSARQRAGDAAQTSAPPALRSSPATLAYRQHQSATQKALWADPEYKARTLARTRAVRAARNGTGSSVPPHVRTKRREGIAVKPAPLQLLPLAEGVPLAAGMLDQAGRMRAMWADPQRRAHMMTKRLATRAANVAKAAELAAAPVAVAAAAPAATLAAATAAAVSANKASVVAAVAAPAAAATAAVAAASAATAIATATVTASSKGPLLTAMPAAASKPVIDVRMQTVATQRRQRTSQIVTTPAVTAASADDDQPFVKSTRQRRGGAAATSPSLGRPPVTSKAVVQTRRPSLAAHAGAGVSLPAARASQTKEGSKLQPGRQRKQQQVAARKAERGAVKAAAEAFKAAKRQAAAAAKAVKPASAVACRDDGPLPDAAAPVLRTPSAPAAVAFLPPGVSAPEKDSRQWRALNAMVAQLVKQARMVERRLRCLEDQHASCTTAAAASITAPTPGSPASANARHSFASLDAFSPNGASSQLSQSALMGQLDDTRRVLQLVHTALPTLKRRLSKAKAEQSLATSAGRLAAPEGSSPAGRTAF